MTPFKTSRKPFKTGVPLSTGFSTGIPAVDSSPGCEQLQMFCSHLSTCTVDGLEHFDTSY